MDIIKAMEILTDRDQLYRIKNIAKTVANNYMLRSIIKSMILTAIGTLSRDDIMRFHIRNFGEFLVKAADSK